MNREFYRTVADILENEDFKKLSTYVQHKSSTRLHHSIHVSYISWKIAKAVGSDEVKAARIGLLHDFFLYDWRTDDTPQMHAFYHPKLAAVNSRAYFKVNDREARAIETHMFPLGPMPTSSLGWIVTMADKICAVNEFMPWHEKEQWAAAA